jgi:hypothetical protein
MGEELMTPEERAVIEAAFAWKSADPSGDRADAETVLWRALEALDDEVPRRPTEAEYGSLPILDPAILNRDLPAEEPVRTAETLPCWECLTDPTEDPSPWCDCRELGERCTGPCRKRAHAPDRCPNMSPAWRARNSDLVPEWIETTMRQCLAGDRIRIGAEETDVIRSSSGIWHADSSDAWHPRGWEHLELRMELAAVPGFTQYPPNASVEILCTPGRKALLLLQGSFPGTTVIS